MNQSEAFYKYRNFDWQKEERVVINGDDFYKYNQTIKPALPLFIALTYLVEKEPNDYFVYQFFSLYYYCLLLGVFLFLIKCIRDEGGRKKDLWPYIYGIIFFLFSWYLTRILIFNAKEGIIYFLILSSVYLSYKLMKSGKNDFSIQILLGIILGLNSFINLHGVIVEIIILIMLLLLSKNKILSRIYQVIFILMISIPFGFFELFLSLNFLFHKTFSKIINFFNSKKDLLLTELREIKADINPIAKSVKGKSVVNINKVIVTSLDPEHKELYQMNSWISIYIKGKLQLITNIGYFGFYFWFFLVAFASNFREIFRNNLAKIILFFILIYYIILIDPFNINGNPFAIVLWGSSKYSMLLLLFCMIILSAYSEKLISSLNDRIMKYKKTILVLLLCIMLILIYFKEKLTLFATSILLSSIQVYKEESFYFEKINNLYIWSLLSILLLLVGMIIINKRENGKIFMRLVVFFVFIFTPFAITNVGKYPLTRTMSYINSDRKFQLENIINKENTFKAYFYLEDILPRKTLLGTDFNEIYVNDNHFILLEGDQKYAKREKMLYKISNNCNSGWH
ncbi:MAG: hypothetical protein WA019_05500, partial [Candidatus Moraniibacteriota bacterium]